MKNLGRNVLLLVLLIILPAWADFSAKISDTRISQGDQIVLTLASTVNGDLPILNEIGGNVIESSSRDNAISYINGKKTGLFKVYYVFTPEKSFTVPSYEMKENGQTVRTQPIKVTVAPYSFDKDKGDLVLKVTTAKKNVIVGEPFIVTLIYKQRRNLDVVDRRLTPPSGKHLWVDKDPIQSASKTAEYEKIQLDYVFTAQKPGQLTINPANIKVGESSYRRDPWGIPRSIPRYKTVFSDDIIINAIALPEGVENVGDFTMKVEVDKTQSNEKDAIHLTIDIAGKGNVADIKPFAVTLDNVLVYDEAPKHENALKNGEYLGHFTQKFALVGDSNYTIPAFDFSFYNPKNKSVKHLKSKPIPITIIRTKTATPVKALSVERGRDEHSVEKVIAKRSFLEMGVIFILGFLLGLMTKNFHLMKRFFTMTAGIGKKDEKELLSLLIPYVHENEEVKKFVELLSDNIYHQAAHSIDKKALNKLIKQVAKKV